MTRFDARRKLAFEVDEKLRERYGNLVCATRIGENAALAASPMHGQDVFEFASFSPGAADYRTLTEERAKHREDRERWQAEHDERIAALREQHERFFEDPAPGRWHLELVPYSAEEAPFRLRFKLEAEPYVPAPNAAGELLPNLRVTRLWEFTFAAPLNPANGLFPPDDINPPLSAAGVASAGASVSASPPSPPAFSRGATSEIVVTAAGLSESGAPIQRDTDPSS